MCPGCFDDGFCPATYFRGGFIGVSWGCDVFSTLGCNIFEGV